MKYYQNLRAAIAEKELTHEEACALMGISRQSLYLRLIGERDFKLQEALNFHEAVGKTEPIEELFKK